MPAATRLCIVRHGETDWNLDKRIQGHQDIPLNPSGRRQALALGAGLTGHGFQAVHASDLQRAWQTARLIGECLGLPIQPAPGLRERHYGVLQGLTAAEIAARYPEFRTRYQTRDRACDFGGGESLVTFAERMFATIQALVAGHPGQTLLLVSHGGVLDLCYRRASGRDLSAPRDFVIPNGAINWFEAGPDGWRLLEWANRRYLEEALDESPE